MRRDVLRLFDHQLIGTAHDNASDLLHVARDADTVVEHAKIHEDLGDADGLAIPTIAVNIG